MGKIKSSITKPASITGYKGFHLNRNGQPFCNPTGGKGKIYTTGKIVDKHDARICNKGIHFCVKPQAVDNYYSISDVFGGNTNVFAKLTVPTNQNIESRDNKRAAKTVFIDEFYTAAEFVKKFGKKFGRYEVWPGNLFPHRNKNLADPTFSIILYVKKDSYGYIKMQAIDVQTAKPISKTLTRNIVGAQIKKSGIYSLKGELYKMGNTRYLVVNSVYDHVKGVNTISLYKQIINA